MIRRLAALPVMIALTFVAAPAASATTLATTTTAAPSTTTRSDKYISNHTEDRSIARHCAEQAELANNLVRQGGEDTAMRIVSEANMRGCRIYTFEASWSEGQQSAPVATTTPIALGH